MLKDDLSGRKESRPPITGFRDYQMEAVLKTKEYFESKRQACNYPIALIIAPTGAGKSGMITMLPYVLPCSKVFVQTFFNQFCTIIVDEAHHWPAKTWLAIVNNFQASGKRILFLTATPERKGKPILPHANIVYTVDKSQIEGEIFFSDVSEEN